MTKRSKKSEERRRQLDQAVDGIKSRFDEQAQRISRIEQSLKGVADQSVSNLRRKGNVSDSRKTDSGHPLLDNTNRPPERRPIVTDSSQSDSDKLSAKSVFKRTGHRCTDEEARLLPLVLPDMWYEFQFKQDKITAAEVQLRIRQADETDRISHDLVPGAEEFLSRVKKGEIPWREVNDQVQRWAIEFPWLYDVYFGDNNQPVFPGNGVLVCTDHRVNGFYTLTLVDYTVGLVMESREAYNRDGNLVKINDEGQIVLSSDPSTGSRTYMPFGSPGVVATITQQIHKRITVLNTMERTIRSSRIEDMSPDTRIDWADQQAPLILNAGDSDPDLTKSAVDMDDSMFADDGTRFTPADQDRMDELDSELLTAKRNLAEHMLLPAREPPPDDKVIYFTTHGNSFKEVFPARENGGFVDRQRNPCDSTIWNANGQPVTCVPGGVVVFIQNGEKLKESLRFEASRIIDEDHKRFVQEANELLSVRDSLQDELGRLESKKLRTEQDDRLAAEQAAAEEAEAIKKTNEERKLREIVEAINRGDTDRYKHGEPTTEQPVKADTMVLPHLSNPDHKKSLLGIKKPLSSGTTVNLRKKANGSMEVEPTNTNETSEEGVRMDKPTKVVLVDSDGDDIQGAQADWIDLSKLIGVTGEELKVVQKDENAFLDSEERPHLFGVTRESYDESNRDVWVCYRPYNSEFDSHISDGTVEVVDDMSDTTVDPGMESDENEELEKFLDQTPQLGDEDLASEFRESNEAMMGSQDDSDSDEDLSSEGGHINFTQAPAEVEKVDEDEDEGEDINFTSKIVDPDDPEVEDDEPVVEKPEEETPEAKTDEPATEELEEISPEAVVEVTGVEPSKESAPETTTKEADIDAEPSELIDGEGDIDVDLGDLEDHDDEELILESEESKVEKPEEVTPEAATDEPKVEQPEEETPEVKAEEPMVEKPEEETPEAAIDEPEVDEDARAAEAVATAQAAIDAESKADEPEVKVTERQKGSGEIRTMASETRDDDSGDDQEEVGQSPSDFDAFKDEEEEPIMTSFIVEAGSSYRQVDIDLMDHKKWDVRGNGGEGEGTRIVGVDDSQMNALTAHGETSPAVSIRRLDKPGQIAVGYPRNSLGAAELTARSDLRQARSTQASLQGEELRNSLPPSPGPEGLQGEGAEGEDIVPAPVAETPTFRQRIAARTSQGWSWVQGRSRNEKIGMGVGALLLTLLLVWMVMPSNKPPVLEEVAAVTQNVGSELRIELKGSDANNDDLAYGLKETVNGANLEGNVFTWTPTAAQAGANNLTFTVNDGEGGTAEQVATITVNRLPSLSPIADQVVVAGNSLRFSLRGSDEDEGSVLRYSMQEAPEGASLNEKTGSFLWTPPVDIASGERIIKFTVSDQHNARSSEVSVKITVRPALHPVTPESRLTEAQRRLLARFKQDPNKTWHELTREEILKPSDLGLPEGATDEEMTAALQRLIQAYDIRFEEGFCIFGWIHTPQGKRARLPGGEPFTNKRLGWIKYEFTVDESLPSGSYATDGPDEGPSVGVENGKAIMKVKGRCGPGTNMNPEGIYERLGRPDEVPVRGFTNPT